MYYGALTDVCFLLPGLCRSRPDICRPHPRRRGYRNYRAFLGTANFTWTKTDIRSFQADKIVALTNAAGVEVEPIWATLLEKALAGKNVKELLSNVGAGGGAPAAGSAAPAAAAGGAPAAEAAKVEEKVEEKEESDDDMVRRYSDITNTSFNPVFPIPGLRTVRLVVLLLYHALSTLYTARNSLNTRFRDFILRFSNAAYEWDCAACCPVAIGRSVIALHPISHFQSAFCHSIF